MKDEIKEFNEEMYVEMIEDGTLYDYITNLQERIDKAVEYNKEIIKALLSCCSYEKDKVEDMLYEQQNILESKGE